MKMPTETERRAGASKLGMAMVKRTHLGVMVVAWAAWGAVLCGAQSAPVPNPAPCTVAPQPEPCGTKPAGSAKPDAIEKFPFPGEASDKPAGPPSLSGVPEAPDASATPSSPAPAGKKEFPFPGDVSKPDASANGSSSSSSSSSGDDAPLIDPGATPDASSGSTPALKDKGSEGSNATPGRHILHRVNPVGTKLLTPDEREAEDLSIAHFYTQTGDLQGAYLRSKDAVKIAPDDPDAHFALAEAALKLNKKDEAIAEYEACLKLDPSDKEVKASHKALARLKP
jgi:Tetratricopeptide repeat